MATFNLKGFVVQDTDTKDFRFNYCESTYSWSATVCPISIDIAFDIPEGYSIISSQIQAKQKELDRLADEYQKACIVLRGELKDLQALAYETAVDHDAS